jgi:WD40 repeat protein/predicted Ser/Thr protein kinase
VSITRERRIKRLFEEAAAREGADRAVFLDTLGGDTRAEVEGLLAAQRAMGDFLDAPAVQRLHRPLAEGTSVGRYTILGVLGAGGTGTVYLAAQERPRRRVALKVLRVPQRRFQEEAEILARLKHPGIAHVYEAGLHEGLPWFALEYVEGAKPLTAHARALDRRARLALFAAVCDAVHHGHQKGIIHRDLKPGNVLVDDVGRPRVIDFGIAQLVDGAQPHEVAGTPPYMSPGQLDPGAGPDVRSDVYALGVILYELLSGRLPYEVRGATLDDAARIVRENEPAPLDRAFRGDLDAIVRRAMARDPEARYASAEALAADVRRHLACLPVEARPATLRYQLGRFARRQRIAFGSIAAVVVISLAAAAVSEAQRRVAVGARERQRLLSYVSGLGAADAALRVQDTEAARRQLLQAPPDLRHWEWSFLAARLDADADVHHLKPMYWAQIDPSSGRLVTISRGGPLPQLLRIVDVRTGEELGSRALRREGLRPAIRAGGRSVACGREGGGLDLFDAPTLSPSATLATGEEATFVSFAAGRLAAAGPTGPVRVFEGPPWKLRAELPVGPSDAASLACGGALVAVGTKSGAIRLWDPGTARRVAVLEGHGQPVTHLAFRPDGTRILSTSTEGTARLWEVPSGRPLFTWSRRGDLVSAIAFSADGALALCGYDDGTVTLWDAASGVEVETRGGHADAITAIAEVEGRIVSVSADGLLRRWAPGATPAATILGRYEGRSRDVDFSPDGRWLAAACNDRTVKVYDMATGAEVAALEGHLSYVRSVSFDGTGTLLASASSDGAVKLWEAPRWRPVKTIEAGGDVREVALAPDGRSVITSPRPAVTVWDVATGARLWERPQPQGTGDFALSRDGTRLAVPSWEGNRGFLDLHSFPDGKPLWRVGIGEGPPPTEYLAAAFDRGDSILVATGPGGIRRYAAADGRLLRTYAGLPGTTLRVASSPDGRRLAGAGTRVIRIWDAESGEPVLELRGHKSYVYGLAWSPDGSQIASSGGFYDGKDCTVRLWGRTPGTPWPPRLE